MRCAPPISEGVLLTADHLLSAVYYYYVSQRSVYCSLRTAYYYYCLLLTAYYYYCLLLTSTTAYYLPPTSYNYFSWVLVTGYWLLRTTTTAYYLLLTAYYY